MTNKIVKRLTTYIKTSSWMKPIRSAGFLAAGKSVQAVLSLAYLALAARTLGPIEFGILILVHSCVLAVAKTARFQTWQALIHYGAKANESEDKPALFRLIKFSFLLDILSALAAYAVIFIFADGLTTLFKFETDSVATIRLYGIAILFMTLNGTPTGLLQLFDRFDYIARYTAIAPLIRFIGTLYLFVTAGSLTSFFIIWFIAEICAAIGLMVLTAITLKKNNLLSGLTSPSTNILTPEPKIWRYVWGTQIASTLDLTTTHLPVLVTGGLLGPAAAGLFRIAKQFASIIMKPNTKLFGRAIYSDLAKLTAQNDIRSRRTMLIRTAIFAGSFSVVIFALLVLFGKTLIMVTAGHDYTGSYTPMLWLAASGIIGALSFALEPLLIATGTIKKTVFIRIFVTIIYIPALFLLLQKYGISGAGMAATIHAFISAILMIWTCLPLLKNKTS